jgi:acetyltransferase-like isoleucine patch superfamily enzyme
MSISESAKIDAKNVQIGKGVVVEDDVVIIGKGKQADAIILGDYCYIGRGTRIITPEFRLGDYSKLHAQSFAHGQKPMKIGRNCWIGGNTVLDSQGGLDIDDGVGIGAQSQIWTHIQFGDIVEGSRFYSDQYMHIGKDAWFVGHCIVSPVKVGEKSMALVGSVVTRDMEPNHIYGGSPAKDLTDRLGSQFEERTVEQKAYKMNKLIGEFESGHPEFKGQLRVVTDESEIVGSYTCFNVANRTYTKTHSNAEVSFLKAYVPLVKFVPHDEAPFI